MPTVTWQVWYDNAEPKTLFEVEHERIIELRWLLDIEEGNYTLEELEEMYDNRDERNHEG